MPMSHWDRFNTYISDYLEGNLDSSTRHEFEQECKNNPELSNLTSRVGKLSKLLTDLPAHKCSNEFNVKLRDRIHNETKAHPKPVSAIKKYSYAFSFVIVIVILFFTIGALTDSDDSFDQIPASSNTQQFKSDPVNQTDAQLPSQVQADDKQVDIKTKYENPSVTDSLNKELKEKDKKSKIKYVDETK